MVQATAAAVRVTIPQRDANGLGLRRLGQVDRALEDDRPRVDALVDEVDRGAGELDAVVERLPLRVETRERRKQRRMDVQDAAGERADEPAREDPHEAGEADEPDAVLVEHPGEGHVVRGAVTEVLRVEPDGGDAAGPRARERRRLLLVPNGDDHARGVEERLEIRAAPRDEHADPQPVVVGARHATSSTPRAPLTISPMRTARSPASARARRARSVAAGGTTTT